MSEARGAWAGLLIGLLGVALCLSQIELRYRSPYPPITVSVGSADTMMEDVAGVALGLRRLTADLAWMQTLQYYGTPEEDHQEPGHSEAHSPGHVHTHDTSQSYPLFLRYCQRVTRIDPYFTYAYYYGGAVLGWNLERLPEAELLLKEGIAKNPHEWRLPQYLAGLAYQKNHDIAKLTEFLEVVVKDPECPLLMKALLANIYKKQRLFDKALQMWQTIYDSGDPDYIQRAETQTREIMRLRHTSALTK